MNASSSLSTLLNQFSWQQGIVPLSAIHSELSGACLYGGLTEPRKNADPDPVFLVELTACNKAGRFLLSRDGCNYFRPSILRSQGDQRATLQSFLDQLPTPLSMATEIAVRVNRDKELRAGRTREGVFLFELMGAKIVLGYTMGHPILWRYLPQNPFEPWQYTTSQLSHEHLLAGGFRVFDAPIAEAILSNSTSRLLDLSR